MQLQEYINAYLKDIHYEFNISLQNTNYSFSNYSLRLLIEIFNEIRTLKNIEKIIGNILVTNNTCIFKKYPNINSITEEILLQYISNQSQEVLDQAESLQLKDLGYFFYTDLGKMKEISNNYRHLLNFVNFTN